MGLDLESIKIALRNKIGCFAANVACSQAIYNLHVDMS